MMHRTHRKPRICGLLTALLVSMTAVSFTPAMQTSAADTQNILVLGDGISSGEGLEAGESGYAEEFAACAGGKLTNLAVPGYTTTDLLAQLNNAETAAAVKAADFISISIGGNDLLIPGEDYLRSLKQDGETMMQTLKRISKQGTNELANFMSGLTETLRTPRNTAKANYPLLEEKLRALNPDAVIVMQTVYNPYELSDSYFAKGGYTQSDIANFQMFLDYVSNNEKQLNNAIKALETVTVADVSEAFAGSAWLYDQVYDLDVRPSALGQALIASVVLKSTGVTGGSSGDITRAMENTLLTDYETIPADDLALMQRYAAPSAQKFGDVDNDGKITAGDSQYVLLGYLESLSGNVPLVSYGAMRVGRVAGGDAMTAEDSQMILLYYLENVIAGNQVTWFDITGNPNAPDAP